MRWMMGSVRAFSVWQDRACGPHWPPPGSRGESPGFAPPVAEMDTAASSPISPRGWRIPVIRLRKPKPRDFDTLEQWLQSS